MVSSISSVTRSSLMEYANILVDLDRIVANYLAATTAEKLNRARSLSSIMAVMRDLQRLGLAGTSELRDLMGAITQRADPVLAKIFSGTDSELLEAMNAFILPDSDGVTAESLINKALNPTYWQTDGQPITIRDSISDFAFFEYYRTADAVMASNMGQLANRIQVSENFLKAINLVYQGVTWNPGAEFINTKGELQDAVSTVGEPQYFQAKSGSTWNDPTYALLRFNASNVNTSNNTITVTGHGFSNGDQVYYTAPNGNASGLEYQETYWVIDVSGDSFKLTTQKGNSGSIVNITSQGSSDQQLERYSAVDLNANSIYLPSHGFVAGDAVVYQSASPIGGLQSGLTYYVQTATTNTITLASTASGSVIDLSYDLSSNATTTNTFTKAGVSELWYDKFVEDEIGMKMTDGITALKNMLNAGLLPADSIERSVADQIIAKWDTPYSSGGLNAVATSDSAGRMWSDKAFKKIIEDGINGTSRLNEQSQLALTRALSNYDFFTRSASTFATRESDAVKANAQKIRLG